MTPALVERIISYRGVLFSGYAGWVRDRSTWRCNFAYIACAETH